MVRVDAAALGATVLFATLESRVVSSVDARTSPKVVEPVPENALFFTVGAPPTRVRASEVAVLLVITGETVVQAMTADEVMVELSSLKLNGAVTLGE
jgi:hypothetical protein